jgi:hypothetical protein
MPSSKAAAREEASRTLRYVGPLSDAGTPLADFFSNLLGRHLRDLLFSMIGASHQRAGLDMGEAKGHPLLFEEGKVSWIVEARNRQMLFGGLEILADGHDVAVNGAEIAHDFAGLVHRLSHPKDQSGFGAHAQLLRLAE